MFPTDLATLELVEEYLEKKGELDLDQKTLDAYAWTLRAFAKANPVLPFDQDTVERWCIRTKLAASSIRTHFKNLRTFYYWLARRKGLPKLDLTTPELPVDKSVPTYWTQQQLGTILAACQTQWEACIVIVLAQTGCRREDLCNITAKTLQYSLGGSWAKVECKRTPSNPAGERIIYIPKEAELQITMCMGGRGWMHLARGRMTKENIKKPLRELLKRAKIWTPGDACHAFRHSYSAEFIHNGGDRMQMDVIMGHLSGDMSRHYTHFPAPEIMEQAMKCAPRRFLAVAEDIRAARRLARQAAEAGVA